MKTHRTKTHAFLLAGCLVSCLSAATADAATVVEAPQGSVVRWQGAAKSCGMDGKSWQSLEGNCYYAIDFQRAPGRIEIARWLSAGGMERAWVQIVAKDFGEENIEFPDDSYVHLSEENLARLYREQAEVKPLFRRRGAARFSLPLGPPAKPLPEGKYFGERRSFNGESKNPHTGVDYAISLDQPALAVAAGEVVLTGEHFFAGSSVYVDHGDGLISMYFHLGSIGVQVGQTVAAGDELGKVGSTGRSTGPHLHLGLRWKGARIDPTPLLDPLSLVEVP